MTAHAFLPREGWHWAAVPAVAQAAPLLLIPVLVPVLALRYGVEKGQMPGIFAAGGMAALAASKMAALAIVKWGDKRVALWATVLLCVSFGLLSWGRGHAELFMVLFMAATYVRLVCASSYSAGSPSDTQRGRFMTLQSAMLHLASCAALAVPSLVLGDPVLSGASLDKLLIVAASLAATLPLTMQREKKTTFSSP
ncbi:hypothetical protein [Alcaligenes sp. WGS1538]|uniref:hypothetical protein n=1 Tax=Alcaligenes sp. WGS1538 TaxID=3366811 RepID=UPI00372D2C17